MSNLDIDWSKAPSWANWAAQDADGTVQVFECRPSANATCEAWRDFTVDGLVERVSSKSPTTAIWTATLTQRPQTGPIHQDNDGAGVLRAQIGHLLEDMTPEQLDALHAHVRQQLDAAKFDELNRQLNKPFGGVPRERQLKAFEAFLDGAQLYSWHPGRHIWTPTPNPIWIAEARYRVKPKQS